MKSPRKSFKGYDFGVALYRNKDMIKAIVALFGTINIIETDWKVFGITLAGALLTLAVKMAQDAIDYYFTEVDI